MNHIQKEIKQKIDEQTKELKERANLKREENTFEEKERKVAVAEKFLATNCIANLQDIVSLEEELLQRN